MDKTDILNNEKKSGHVTLLTHIIDIIMILVG